MPEDKEINTKLKVANQNIIVSISHIKTANKETQDGLKYCDTIRVSIFPPAKPLPRKQRRSQNFMVMSILTAPLS